MNLYHTAIRDHRIGRDSAMSIILLGGYYDLFDAVYASNKMGVSKPHQDFYRYILMSEGVKPEDTVFIDDSEEYVILYETTPKWHS